jgi:hypothetical protein
MTVHVDRMLETKNEALPKQTFKRSERADSIL